MNKFAAVAVVIAAVFVFFSPAFAGGKKCVGATPCMACKSCENCGYCKSGKKCGACRNSVLLAAKPETRKTLCDGVMISGPKASLMLPLPASDERVATTFASAGLLYRNETAYDTTGGAMNERYRLKFAYDYLVSVESDTVFATPAAAEQYADSLTKFLRSATVAKEEIMVAVGLGGHKTYYAPALICGNRALSYVFTLAPDLAGKTATLTRQVTMTILPNDK